MRRLANLHQNFPFPYPLSSPPRQWRRRHSTIDATCTRSRRLRRRSISPSMQCTIQRPGRSSNCHTSRGKASCPRAFAKCQGRIATGPDPCAGVPTPAARWISWAASHVVLLPHRLRRPRCRSRPRPSVPPPRRRGGHRRATTTTTGPSTGVGSRRWPDANTIPSWRVPLSNDRYRNDRIHPVSRSTPPIRRRVP